MPPEKKPEPWYVVYEVKGYPGEQIAGPYEGQDAAEAQRADIRGYEGVQRAYLTTNPTNRRTAP